MDKKTIYVIVAVIVVVLIVGVAGVMLLNQGGNGGDTTTTPTPEPSVSVSNATSIQFTVTDSSASITYEYQCKNLNAADEMLRVDMDLGESGTYNYIIDMGAQASWMSTDDGATWTAGTFADDCTNYATPFHTYLDKIIENGGTADFDYTTDTGTIAISGITVNPTIEDSVFATS